MDNQKNQKPHSFLLMFFPHHHSQSIKINIPQKEREKNSVTFSYDFFLLISKSKVENVSWMCNLTKISKNQ